MDRRNLHDLANSSVAHYTIAGLIGTGSMGQVYAARDSRLNRDVAIKVIHRTAGETAPARALAEEARILSRLDHPNVARLYELVSKNGTDFLVMEFVAGPTIRQLLSEGPLELAEAIRLGCGLARGLAAVHHACVLHRDIKPENLKVTAGGHVKILDFGVAIGLPRPGGNLTTIQGDLGVAGTIAYMAPEQLRGEEIDERSDVYSAGAVLYEMVCGRRAFPQQQVACLIDSVLHGVPEAADRLNPDVPAAIAEVVTRAMSKHPADRQQSARELADDLEDVTSAVSRPSLVQPVLCGNSW
jgi:serine/threonine-protein kinase